MEAVLSHMGPAILVGSNQQADSGDGHNEGQCQLTNE